MRQPVTAQAHRPQTQCEVCRAAQEFVRARDALVNSGMDTADDHGRDRNHPIIRRMRMAAENWNYAQGGRHTGAVHTPEVV